MRSRQLWIRVALAAGIVACDNAGEERVLSIDATGVVNAVVYLDLNGNRQPNGGEPGLAGVRVGLIVRGTTDTAFAAQTSVQGGVRFAGVPVGHYVVTVDTGTFGDSIGVTRIDSAGIQVPPGDSAGVIVTVSFPAVTVAGARALPLGEKVFLEGLVLVSGGVFGDSTLHLRDTTGSIRFAGLSSTLALAGDTARFLGVRAARAGQPVLSNVSLVALFGVSLPTPPSDTVTNAVALAAGGGSLDAAFVEVPNDTIVDTLTLTAAPDSGDFRMRVFDGTDTLVVLLDAPGGAWTSFASYAPGLVITQLRGLLVPTGTGTWRLKPRSPNDLRCGGSAC